MKARSVLIIIGAVFLLSAIVTVFILMIKLSSQQNNKDSEFVDNYTKSLIQNSVQTGPAANKDLFVSKATLVAESGDFKLVEISLKQSGFSQETNMFTVLKGDDVILKPTSEWTVGANNLDVPDKIKSELEKRLLSE